MHMRIEVGAESWVELLQNTQIGKVFLPIKKHAREDSEVGLIWTLPHSTYVVLMKMSCVDLQKRHLAASGKD